MSSGTFLLHQLLQQKQRRQHLKKEKENYPPPLPQEKVVIIDNDTHDNGAKNKIGYATAAESPTDDNNNEIVRNDNEKKKMIKIEVCLGPDCSGGGGGAAFLEIEDLIMNKSRNNNTNIQVMDGGCRDFCTMGPNVYIHGDTTTITTTTTTMNSNDESHFTKVFNPAACRRIVQLVTTTEEAADKTDSMRETNPNFSAMSTSSTRDNILLLREDGRRWRKLREKAAKERRLRIKERETKSSTK